MSTGRVVSAAALVAAGLVGGIAMAGAAADYWDRPRSITNRERLVMLLNDTRGPMCTGERAACVHFQFTDDGEGIVVLLTKINGASDADVAEAAMAATVTAKAVANATSKEPLSITTKTAAF